MTVKSKKRKKIGYTTHYRTTAYSRVLEIK